MDQEDKEVLRGITRILNVVVERLDGIDQRLDRIETRMDRAEADIQGLKATTKETNLIVRGLREHQEVTVATLDNFEHKKATFEYVDELNGKMDTRVTRLEDKVAL